MEKVSKECLLKILHSNISSLERGIKSSLHYKIDNETSVYIFGRYLKEKCFLGKKKVYYYYVQVTGLEKESITEKDFKEVWSEFVKCEKDIVTDKQSKIIDKIKVLCK